MVNTMRKKKHSIRIIDCVFFLYVTSLFNIYGGLRIVIEFGTIGILLLNRLNNHRHVFRPVRNRYYVWGIAMVCICAGSVFWGDSTSASLYGTRGVLECFLAGAVIQTYFEIENDTSKFFKYMVYAALILFAVVLVTIPMNRIISRQFSESINANSFGMKMAIGFVIVFWLWKEGYYKGSITIILEAIMLIGTVLSGSKKALFIVGGGIAVLLLLYQRNPLRIIAYAFFVIGLLAIGFYYLMNNPMLYGLIGYRVEGMINAFIHGADYGDASTRERLLLIDMAIEYWKKRPVLGYGINSFGEVVQYSNYGRTNIYTHCNYTELLFGVGVVGIVVYYSIYVWIGKWSLRYCKLKNEFRLLLALLVVMAVLDIGLVSYGDEYMQFLIALSCGAITRQQLQQRKKCAALMKE